MPAWYRQFNYVFQSTLPWWERPDKYLALMGDKTVSIHAPVVGATLRALAILSVLGCFNPRSRGGSDMTGLRWKVKRTCFNPRSRGGSDLGDDGFKQYLSEVSIHAPVVGATSLA